MVCFFVLDFMLSSTFLSQVTLRHGTKSSFTNHPESDILEHKVTTTYTSLLYSSTTSPFQQQRDISKLPENRLKKPSLVPGFIYPSNETDEISF